MPGRMTRTGGMAATAAGLAVIGMLADTSHAQTPPEPTPVRQNPNIERPITNENYNNTLLEVLQELVSIYGPIATGNDVPNPYTRIEPFGDPPPGNDGEWAAVTGAEAGPDGFLYVLHRCHANSCVDRSEPPLVKLDPQTGERVAAWGQGLMSFPHGLFIDHDGNVWTTDTGAGGGAGGHLVRKFSPDGELLMTIGRPGVAGDDPGLFREPTDVVVSPEGMIFVTEGHQKNGPHARLTKLGPDGTFIERYGSTGQGHLQLSAPHGIAMDTEGRLFIADRDNNRILIWDQDGHYIDQWTQFGRPSGLYIDQTDTIYVADSESWGPENPGWRKGIRIGSARTGQVHYFLEDIESRDPAHSGAEAIGVDLHGNVYGGVVRRQMLEKHVAPTDRPTRGATWPATAQASRRMAPADATTIRMALTSVFVDDQAKALNFYTSVLGLEKKQDIPVGAFRWLTVVSPGDRDGTELLLEPNDNPAARTFQEALFAQGIPATALAVDDLQREYERLKAKGVAFTSEPRSIGTATIVAFDDTCGNLIQLYQEIE